MSSRIFMISTRQKSGSPRPRGRERPGATSARNREQERHFRRTLLVEATVHKDTLAQFGTDATVELDARTQEALEDGAVDFEAHTRHAGRPGPTRPGPSPSHLPRGTEVGRYTVLELLGAGGMGSVYAAYDPQLDRRVAIKLLHSSGASSAHSRSRLLREAKALAQIAHPNVVTIHDVGTFGDQIYLAMEHVAGGDLFGWLTTERPWQEVLAVFIAAGEGLASAHRAGLVHRDFKPANVLIGGDGRPRVTDFGLVRVDGELPGEEGAQGSAGPPLDRALDAADASWSERLTQDGAVMGTLPFMSLEQLEGRTVDARTDIFAFCVALYEALFGEHPYPGDNWGERLAAIKEGRMRTPPANVGVPKRLRAALRRGLAADAEDRPPTMEALLAELRYDPVARRRRWILGGVLGVAALSVGAALTLLTAGPSAGAICAQAGASVDSLWDRSKREALARGLVAVGGESMRPRSEAAAEALDHWAERWRKARIDACIEAESLAPAQVAERNLCLEEGLREFRNTLKILGDVDSFGVAKAPLLITNLGDPKTCLASDASERLRLPADPALRPAALGLRQRLATIRALRLVGKAIEEHAEAEAALVEAEALAFPPLLAEAHLLLGDAHTGVSRLEEAEAQLTQAFTIGIASAADEVAFSAAKSLLYVVGHRLARRREGDLWRAAAEALGARLGRSDELDLIARSGWHLYLNGDYEAAEASYRRGLAIAQRDPQRDPSEVARVHNAYGGLLEVIGRYDEALEQHYRALELRREAHGETHSSIMISLGNIGIVELRLGRYEAALARSDELLALRREIYGDRGPRDLRDAEWRALALMTMGRTAEVEAILGEFEGSLADGADVATTMSYRALSSRFAAMMGDARRIDETRAWSQAAAENAGGKTSSSIATPPEVQVDLSAALAQAAFYGGDLTGALEITEEVLATQGGRLGPEHPQQVEVLLLRALVLTEGRSFDDAGELLDRAQRIAEVSLGSEHPMLGLVLTARARLDRLARRGAERAAAGGGESVDLERIVRIDGASTNLELELRLALELAHHRCAEGNMSAAQERAEAAIAGAERVPGLGRAVIAEAQRLLAAMPGACATSIAPHAPGV
ncbi:MAG: serine/threonine protein kinase [Nannocystis sp.]|nr:serine/threonine protein kinase [Nannocystis sp.]